MSFARRYYILLAISGVIAFVTQLPGVLLMAAVMFVLPALVLIAGSNLFLYMLLLTPVMWVVTAKQRNWWLIAPALLPAIAVAFLPKEYSDRAYASFEAEHVREDFSKPATLTPKTVAIVGETWERGCTALCEKLLFNGHARAVTVGKERFRVETRTTCPDVTNGNRRVMMQAASGRCLVSETAASGVKAADVVVQIRNVAQEQKIGGMRVSEENRFAPFTVDRVMRYEIHETGALVERRTHIIAETTAAPLVLWMDGVQGSLNGFPSIARVPHETYDETIEAMLQRRYGWPLVEATKADGTNYYSNEAPVDMKVFEDILAREHPAGELISEIDSYAIAQGVRQILTKPAYSEADIATMRKVIGLDGMQEWVLFPTESSGRGWRQELAVLIPDAVARIERPYRKNDTMAHVMSSFLTAAPRELVRPYAARIDKVLSGLRGEEAARLLSVLHEISPNAVVVLKPLASREHAARDGAMMGLCRAASPGRTDIAEVFLRFLREEYSRKSERDESRAAYAGVVQTVGLAEAERVTRYPDKERQDGMRHIARFATEKPWPESCGFNL
jgi:hypothetical protein